MAPTTSLARGTSGGRRRPSARQLRAGTITTVGAILLDLAEKESLKGLKDRAADAKAEVEDLERQAARCAPADAGGDA